MVNKEFDEKYRKEYGNIIGIDEVGRGSLAGPVVVAAVLLDTFIEGIDDSKKISPKKRELLAAEIIKRSKFAIGIATPYEVDIHNVLGSTRIAMERAFKRLGIDGLAIVDGPEIGLNFNHKCVVRGDSISPSIAAASIIAKVYRDDIMKKISRFFAPYDFEHNVGYGTKKHIQALEKYGPTLFHRFTYTPVYKNIDYKKIKGWIDEGRLSKDRIRYLDYLLRV
ncbi:MAG: ribonuclease HII [Mesoaciditoga sp.]|uniref:ribonuclease HII n=1 Tax=Athalassotoga sp. TaxID=2022597 RepID=UPI000CBBBDCA|nr:MAG: ribonuclease HII [Mesoaciditoga sp.]PMP78709.1 MAG: ribonuclease HII [Mesoaciditoga sp.]HEU24296.1 ribonuclease HII [Mesoaciditoga lauensis]